MTKQNRATFCGIGAILLWGLLALLTIKAGKIPPFQMAAITFTIGGITGLAVTLFRGKLKHLSQPPLAWLVGVGGLFGFHALYFAALQSAPAAEANLINYLWPLLIVFFAAIILPEEKIKICHIVGALIGFCGVLVLSMGNGMAGFKSEALIGFALAAASSVVWALYSVLSRKLVSVPTDAVTGFCIATAILSAICHILLETTVWPSHNTAWIAMILAGIGPVGAAFFLWDIGMKQGNITILSAASYATPVLSTLVLVIFGEAKASISLLAACGLIAGGAFIASRNNA